MSQPEIAVRLFNMFDDDGGYYPERRLWCAVVISSLDEYTEWLERIAHRWYAYQQPVDSSYRFALNHVRQQCRSEWFAMICEMSGFELVQVTRRLDELDKEYCLAAIPFASEAERFTSAWDLRKAAKHRIAN